MVGIVIVTHGDLSKALVSSASLINNHPCSMVSYGLYHGDDISEFKEKVEAAIKTQYACSKQDGVLILTDLFGGSSSNVVVKIMHEMGHSIKIECITGVNLPMVLQATVSSENIPLQELTKTLIKIGQEGIVNLRDRYNL